MPHQNDKGLVASMTNSGVINLYNVPEIAQLRTNNKGEKEIQRLEM
jgi:hypothetical protein